MQVQGGPTPPRPGEPEAETVLVTEAGIGRFTEVLVSARHRLLADFPSGAGGTDAGPSPYELLLMSLGASTAMTLRLFAQRRGWQLEDVKVWLRHEKVPAGARPGRAVDRIERHITLVGPLSDEHRGRLLRIARVCPVYRMLRSELVIDSSLDP